MKRIILTSCLFVLMHALTGCCSCCDMNRGAQCYSNCVPCNNGCTTGGGLFGGSMAGGGCCGDSMDYSLPPSPYATQQFSGPNQRFSQHVRIRQRSVGPVYSSAPMVDMGNGAMNGGMYESFGSEVGPDMGTPQPVPSDSGWQPKSANPALTPPAVPEIGPNAYSTPSPIPAISASQSQVPPPPGASGAVQSSNLVGPDMGPTPTPAPEPVSQMGYRRQVPIQRAF